MAATTSKPGVFVNYESGSEKPCAEIENNDENVKYALASMSDPGRNRHAAAL